MLFGVYDGHGGASCGIVTANRLQHYVTAGLLPTEDLRNHLDQLKLAGTLTNIHVENSCIDLMH